MHTMWKGSISFGLVNIPVKMFAATENKDIKFRYIHKVCHTPVKYEKVCPSCNEDLGPDEIVKGYEYEPGRFVIIEDSDIEAIKPEAGKAIEIVDFVDLREIDPIYFDKSYYLSPQDNGSKAYNLLREAMKQAGRIAVAKIILREKQSLAVVRVYRNLLVMETIFYPDEVRDAGLVPGIPENAEVNQNELNMAIQLIDNLTTEFKPEKYRDEFRDRLVDLINKKVEGEEVVTKPDVQKSNIIDLMQALQASIQASINNKKALEGKAGNEGVTGEETKTGDGPGTGVADGEMKAGMGVNVDEGTKAKGKTKARQKARAKATSDVVEPPEPDEKDEAGKQPEGDKQGKTRKRVKEKAGV